MKLIWKSKRFLNKVDADQNATAQANFYTQLTANYNTDFGQFESVSQNLLKQLQPIVAAGPSQYGFSTAEDANLRSTATTADAAAVKNAQIAANQQITASNGGAKLMPTGAADQLKQEADVAGAQKLSSDEEGITAAGYTQGVQNYDTALGAEGSVMGLMNPNNFAGAANQGGSSANGAIEAATQADDGWMSMIGGLAGGTASALTSWGLKPPAPGPAPAAA
jgi:hypothetical protein